MYVILVDETYKSHHELLEDAEKAFNETTGAEGSYVYLDSYDEIDFLNWLETKDMEDYYPDSTLEVKEL